MARIDCSIHPKFIGINGVRTGESVAESVSALAAATGKDLAAVSGSHSLSEALNFLAMELLGLIGTFRHSGYTSKSQIGRPAGGVRPTGQTQQAEFSKRKTQPQLQSYGRNTPMRAIAQKLL